MRSTTSSATSTSTRPCSSLRIEPSGPGTPFSRFAWARRLPSRSTSASTQRRISRSRWAGFGSRASRHASTARAIGPGSLRRDLAADRHPLVHEGGGADAPALPHFTDAHRVGHDGIGEEHLVEARRAGHAPDAAHLDAGLVHVDDERGETLVLRRVGIGARQQQAVARHVRLRRPDLRAVHDPLVAVAHRAGREPGDVGAGARLAEQLAPDLLGGEDRAQEPLLLFAGAARDERGAAHADAHGVADPRVATPGRVERFVDDLLQRGLGVESAEAHRVVHARQAGVELRAEERGLVVVARVR